MTQDEDLPLLCKNCFRDQGLRLMAEKNGAQASTCTNCGALGAMPLTRDELMALSYQFFVRGSFTNTTFGGAPKIQFNETNSGDLILNQPLNDDIQLLQRTLGIGFFHYGPRLWMVGCVTPLEKLQDPAERSAVIERVLTEYPMAELPPHEHFFRARKSPTYPENDGEYDAPPLGIGGKGRLESNDYPILYGSQDLEICVHESRFAVGDDLYVATLAPTRPLKLLDLSHLLAEENCTEFESLDMAIHMLFLAGSHSYDISRAIAEAAAARGFDGLIYPSYFSLVRTGAMPFETSFGISLRRFPGAAEYERTKIISNLALFGRPIAAGSIMVVGVNRLVITRVGYGISLGPVVAGGC